MSKFIGKVLTINQKWYFTLVLAIIFNIGWNYSNTQRISGLEKENLELKKTNVELLSKNFLGQRVLDQMPFSIWKKVKRKNRYVVKFLNTTAETQFLFDRGFDRYDYYNETDFAVFKLTEAQRFQSEDSLVAHAKTDTVAHFTTEFYDATGNKLIKDGYTRWREIIDSDTIIWGKMDKFYKYK